MARGTGGMVESVEREEEKDHVTLGSGVLQSQTRSAPSDTHTAVLSPAQPPSPASPSPVAAGAVGPSKAEEGTLQEIAHKIADLQASAAATAAAVAAAHGKMEHWQSPGDLSLLETLVVVFFVFGAFFMFAYTGHRRGWWSGKDAKGKYEGLPTNRND